MNDNTSYQLGEYLGMLANVVKEKEGNILAPYTNNLEATLASPSKYMAFLDIIYQKIVNYGLADDSVAEIVQAIFMLLKNDNGVYNYTNVAKGFYQSYTEELS